MQVLKAIDAFWQMYCIPPTISDIQRMTKITSKAAVKFHIDALVRLGKIKIRNQKPVPLWVIERLQK